MDYHSNMHDTSVVHPIRTALQQRWPPMSQAKLARALEMNEGVLGLYLNFKRTPPEGFYLAAAAVLGCDADDIRPKEASAA